jgi:hypothetical protein
MAVAATTLIVRYGAPYLDYGYPQFSIANVNRLVFNIKPCRHRRE